MYNYSEDITNYLFNQMSDLQRRAFELRLVNNPQLAAEVERQKSMLDTLQAIEDIKAAQADPHYAEVDKLTTAFLEEQDVQQRVKSDRPTKNLAGGKVKHFIWRRMFSAAAAAAIFFLIRYLPFETSGMKRVKMKARMQMGIQPNLSRKFGRWLGKNFAKLSSRIHKK